MQRSVLEYLESAVQRFPNRVAYQDGETELTFSDVALLAERIGGRVAGLSPPRRPVLVLAEKSVFVPAMYLGIAAAGCFYVPVSTALPPARMKTIMDTVGAELLLTDGSCDGLMGELGFGGTVLQLDALKCCEPAPGLLLGRRADVLDLDPLYVIFTSGSTGKPKGVVASHRNLIDYIDVFVRTFGISSDEVFGNQAPLDYIAAVRDIYLPLCTGAKTVLLPKGLFSTPQRLFKRLNSAGVTTLCWVAPALALCAELKVFDSIALTHVSKVFFTGSALAPRPLNVWRKYLPNALFVNHYGPTEITASCTYYVVNRDFEDGDTLPIGVPFENTGIVLLNDDNQVPAPGEKGEICVRGTCLVLGYYREPEKTAEVFRPNPLCDIYPDILYHTGDLGSYAPDGNLLFHGRSDSQIKHMGHRVELSEIEACLLALDSVESCCCLYHRQQEQIWLFYTGDGQERELAVFVRRHLPGYMAPRKYVKLEALPTVHNGKVDLQELRKRMV